MSDLSTFFAEFTAFLLSSAPPLTLAQGLSALVWVEGNKTTHIEHTEHIEDLPRTIVLEEAECCAKDVSSMEDSPDCNAFLPPVEDNPFAAELFSAIFQSRGFFFFLALVSLCQTPYAAPDCGKKSYP
jgi:hypothetical protein